MFFLHDVVEPSNLAADDSQNASSDGESFYDEDYYDFGSVSSGELEDQMDVDDPGHRPGDDQPSEAPPAPSASGPSHDSDPSDSPPSLTPTATQDTNTNDEGNTPQDTRKPPKGKSIAHYDLKAKRIVFVSLDVETGGEYCGIIQLSAEIFRKTGSTINRVAEAFNQYVRPPDGTIWNEEACLASHGLTAESRQIQNGRPFVTVWVQFCDWVSRHVRQDEKCILVAYRGETCDLRWIWKHTQAPRSQLSMPPQLHYFMNPLEVIQNYKGCKFHPTKSKLESLELGCVWKYITNRNLNGAHDSLVDAKAQTDIVTHKFFQAFIDRAKSIRTIDEIFTRAEQRNMSRLLEPTRPVHDPWFELTTNDDFTWSLSPEDEYLGPSSGGVWGPSSAMLQLARKGDLAEMFLAIFPLDVLKYIAERTIAYAYEEYVVASYRYDRDGNITKRPILQLFVPSRSNPLPPNARHRWKQMKNGRKFDVTEYSILAWLGSLMYAGAFFHGDNNRGVDSIYATADNGLSIPFIRNTMTTHAFRFHRNFIHFSDSKKQKSKGQRGYDPLFKVTPIIELLMRRIRTVWIAGDKITIDESMIRYMGRAVAFIQYMPRKPIKHGIKVLLYAVPTLELCLDLKSTADLKV